MTSKLDVASYVQLIEENIIAIQNEMKPSLERAHTIEVLKYSVQMQYPSTSYEQILKENQHDNL